MVGYHKNASVITHKPEKVGSIISLVDMDNHKAKHPDFILREIQMLRRMGVSKIGLFASGNLYPELVQKLGEYLNR